MSSITTTVGGNTLPVPAGVLNTTALGDVTLAGIADYIAYWLKAVLDTKLANMEGTSADACPAANRFQYDPDTYFVRNSTPALYVWELSSKRHPHTLLLDIREREIALLYVFDELVAPDALVPRVGLLSLVEDTIHRAAHRGTHPLYGFNGDAPGTSIIQSCGFSRWFYQGGKPGFMQATPGSSGKTAGQNGAILRGYPALRGTFTVWEMVGQDTAGIADTANDFPVSIETGDVVTDTTDFLDGYLIANDGAPKP